MLENYIPVHTRLNEALKRWPDLRVAETGFEIQRIEERIFLVCEVTVWRTADDPRPAIATAAEPFPGRTQFQRDSERMVGFTSALGRALAYMGIETQTGMASQEEVRARQDAPGARDDRPAPTGPSEAQLRMLKALAYVGPPPKSKREASELIDALKEKKMETGEEDPF